MLTIAIDPGDQLRKGHAALAGDFLQAVPELVFKADAGLVPCNNNRALGNRRNRRLHRFLSPRNDHQDASLMTRSLWDIARFDHRMVVGLSPVLRRSSLILFEIVEDQFPVTLKNAQAPFQSRQPRSCRVRWFPWLILVF